jgi:hypothetical protein
LSIGDSFRRGAVIVGGLRIPGSEAGDLGGTRAASCSLTVAPGGKLPGWVDIRGNVLVAGGLSVGVICGGDEVEGRVDGTGGGGVDD